MRPVLYGNARPICIKRPEGTKSQDGVIWVTFRLVWDSSGTRANFAEREGSWGRAASGGDP
ncbi:hypothetical protein GCM10022284_73600 [Streptomyces hundungensis]